MNFLVCDGNWTTDATGITCTGNLLSLTEQEITELVISASSLTPEDVQLLLGSTLTLFALVFGFLALRKVL